MNGIVAPSSISPTAAVTCAGRALISAAMVVARRLISAGIGVVPSDLGVADHSHQGGKEKSEPKIPRGRFAFKVGDSPGIRAETTQVVHLSEACRCSMGYFEGWCEAAL